MALCDLDLQVSAACRATTTNTSTEDVATGASTYGHIDVEHLLDIDRGKYSFPRFGLGGEVGSGLSKQSSCIKCYVTIDIVAESTHNTTKADS